MLFRFFTILAVLALAVSTWLLSSPARRARPQAAADAALPGYYLKDAVLTDFDLAGNPSVRVRADRMDQIAHGNDVALSNVKVDYQPPEGESWTMYGDHAQVEQAAKLINVQGNVRLLGAATGRASLTPLIRSDTLSYNLASQIVTTDDDVRVDFGANSLTARGMSANLKDRTIRLESKVHGVFHP